MSDHANEIERFVGAPFLDYVLYNKQRPSESLAKLYAKEKAFIVKNDKNAPKQSHYQLVAENLLGIVMESEKADHFPVTRSLIRHDGVAIAKALFRIYDN